MQQNRAGERPGGGEAQNSWETEQMPAGDQCCTYHAAWPPKKSILDTKRNALTFQLLDKPQLGPNRQNRTGVSPSGARRSTQGSLSAFNAA